MSFVGGPIIVTSPLADPTTILLLVSRGANMAKVIIFKYANYGNLFRFHRRN